MHKSSHMGFLGQTPETSLLEAGWGDTILGSNPSPTKIHRLNIRKRTENPFWHTLPPHSDLSIMKVPTSLSVFCSVSVSRVYISVGSELKRRDRVD